MKLICRKCREEANLNSPDTLTRRRQYDRCDVCRARRNFIVGAIIVVVGVALLLLTFRA